MDMWKYYDITHRNHEICNPMSDENLSWLIDLVRLDRADDVVDIACGKGEFLIRLAERYQVRGLGIDLSPYYLDEARRRLEHRAPVVGVRFLELDGANFTPEAPHSFRMASCLGASFVYGGYEATLSRLASMVPAGGWVVSGEPYWRAEPHAEYLEVLGCPRDSIGTHFENVKTGEQVGLSLVFTLVSSKGDFDRYEALQWYAADAYARANPADPDVPELIEELTAYRDAYLRWGRDTLGWAVYLFRR
jgi:SAM-dependent methyltransferase